MFLCFLFVLYINYINRKNESHKQRKENHRHKFEISISVGFFGKGVFLGAPNQIDLGRTTIAKPVMVMPTTDLFLDNFLDSGIWYLSID